MANIVELKYDDQVALVTLNLPEKRNPISAPMRVALMRTLLDVLGSGKARVVVITGAGKAFSSGADLDDLIAQADAGSAEHLKDAQSIADFLSFVYRFPLPTIAALNGPAVAGGAGLALVADITIGADICFLCYSEVKIGFIPALVAVYLENAIGTKRCADLLLTGRKVLAEEAKALGLINEVVPAGKLMAEATERARLIASNSPTALKATKKLLCEMRESTFAEAMKAAVVANATARSTADFSEGVNAFLQKRLPVWPRNL